MAAVGITAQAQPETVRDGAGGKPQLSPSQPSAESHRSSRILSCGIPAGILPQDVSFSTKEPQTLSEWQSGFRAQPSLSGYKNFP